MKSQDESCAKTHDLVLADVSDSEGWLMKLTRSVFDVDTLASQLQDEGAKPFVKSSNELIDVIASKGLEPKKAG